MESDTPSPLLFATHFLLALPIMSALVTAIGFFLTISIHPATLHYRYSPFRHLQSVPCQTSTQGDAENADRLNGPGGGHGALCHSVLRFCS